MALSVDELNALTRKHWIGNGKAQDNYFTGNLLTLRLMKKAKRIGGGTKIKAPLIYDGLNGGFFVAGDTFDTSKKEIHTAAEFDWSKAYVNVTYDIDDEIENAGAEQEVNLLMSKLQAAQKTIRDDIIAAKLFDSTGTALAGLDDLFNTTTSTAYGGIAEDDMSTWTANQTTTASTMSLALMRTIRRTAKVGDNDLTDVPSIYLTTDTLRDKYEALLQPQMRYSDNNLAKAGFKNLMFGNAVVVADMKSTASYVTALNERFVKFYVHKKFFFKQSPWKQPTNQAIKVSQILWAGNLVCTQRRAHCQYTSVS